ncbi:unnamed protein product [Lactuca saligna]|uniref:Uncharacterized protein n=1 Tax=Lactuca saligna TaxID=75948 RepID=A0AA36E7L6_LACSI|nr:unnamed protein product [Lactuca saligna]
MLTGDEVSELVEDDDTDSHISDIMEYEHEPDEEVHTFDKTVDDEFLNKLCGEPILNSNQEEVNDDDDEVSDEDDEVVLPVFDENQEWDKMVPGLGMKFSNPLELKLCLTNFAIKNGYDLWYTIRPLNCSSMWPEVDYTKPFPPKKRRLPGRPTMKRKRPNDVPSTSGKVDVQADLEDELEVEHTVMFVSESDSDFESESDVEANIEVEATIGVVPEMEVNIEVPKVDVEANIKVPKVDVEANIEVPKVDANIKVRLVQDNIEEEIQYEVEHEIQVNIQDNVEQEIQNNA